jgi:hypothetical protein
VPYSIYNSHDKDFFKKFSARSPMGRMCQLKELRDAFIFLLMDLSSCMTVSMLIIDIK